MTRAVRWIATLLAAAIPGLATPCDDCGDGEDIDYVLHPFPAGPLAPLDDAGLRLVSEELVVKLGSSFPGLAPVHQNLAAYLRAEYVVENPGPARRVRFVLPLRWDKDSIFPGDSRYEDQLEPVKRGAEAIHVLQPGEKSTILHGCALELPTSPFAIPDTVLPQAVAGRCVATVPVPSGRSTIVLEEALDPGYREIYSPSTDHCARRSVIPLGPAGKWKGPVEEVTVRVELGKNVRNLAKIVSPPDPAWTDDVVEWRFRETNLDTVPGIVIDIGQVKGDYLQRWADTGLARAGVEITAIASSTLEAQGKRSYMAANAIDGNRDTAWCEGAEGNGEGQSLEVPWKLSGGPERACEVRDLLVRPGYARDEASYDNNGRPTRVRFESCDRPEDGFDVQLGAEPPTPQSHLPRWPANLFPREVPDRWDQLPFEVHVPDGVLAKERRCVRMKILQVRPGKKWSDTCVSELVPRIYCRRDASSSPPR